MGSEPSKIGLWPRVGIWPPMDFEAPKIVAWFFIWWFRPSPQEDVDLAEMLEGKWAATDGPSAAGRVSGCFVWRAAELCGKAERHRPFSPLLAPSGTERGKNRSPPCSGAVGGRTLLRWENHLVSGCVNLLHSIGLSSFSQRSSAFSDVFYNLLLPRSRPLLHTRCQHVTMVQKAPSRMFQLVVRMGQEFMVVWVGWKRKKWVVT